ncbi:MAG TPA: PAS domain S-box protein, partial [Polyangiaceae bacterium]
SLATAVALVRVVPKLLELPTRTAELTDQNERLANEILERKRAEEALRRSEAKFRRLSDAGLIGIITVSGRGEVREANTAFLDMLGYTAEDVSSGIVSMGKLSPKKWGTSEAMDRTKAAAAAKVASGGGGVPLEKEYVRKDGSFVPVLVGAAMLDEASDERVAFVLDLTERKKAETAIASLQEGREADAMFRGLLEAAPDAMIIVEREGRVVLVNAQAERLFGYARTELVGQSIDVLVPDAVRESHPVRRNSYFGDPKVRGMGNGLDLLARKKDGTEFPVEISLSPLETKDGMLVSSAIRDTTERRHAETELRRAKEKAEDASRELESFGYSIAHDLRAPLRAINGYSTAIVEDFGSSLEPGAMDFLQRIAAAAARMGKLIDTLLDLSRVAREDVQRKPVDVTATARAIVEQLRTNEPGRVVELVIPEGLVADADPNLVRALLENLLGNAWKFTSKVEHARIELARFRSIDGEDVYSVHDNGAGFDMQHTAKLFSPFQRLHTEAEFAGTGIGLATVQRIVRRHRGWIRAEAEVGRGASFFFTLEEATRRRR